MFCRNCGNKVDDDALFCTKCGTKLSEPSPEKYCVHCGNIIEDDALFCMKCGKKIREEQTQKTENNLESEHEKEIENTEIHEQKAEPQNEKEIAETQPTTSDVEIENKSEVIPEEEASEPVQEDSSAPEIETDVQDENKEKTETQDNAEPASDVPQEEPPEFKDTYIGGKHFLYINDSTKVFCPKCKKEVDSNSTLCFYCNTNFYENKPSVEQGNNSTSENEDSLKIPLRDLSKITKPQQKREFPQAIVWLVIIVFFVGVIVAVATTNTSEKFPSVTTTVEKSQSTQVSSASFNLDNFKPYTFKSNDGRYEYDCYTVSNSILSGLWANPPRYFIYNNKKYEVDNKNYISDYDDDSDGEYNVILE